MGPWHPPDTSLTAWSTPQGRCVSSASGAGNRRAITYDVLLHPVFILCIWSILGFAGGLVCALKLTSRRLIGGPGRRGCEEIMADALHNLGLSTLLTVVAGAFVTHVVYSTFFWRRTAPASPRAKQGRRPEKEAADRRRRRQAGAAAEATQGGAQVGRNATIIGLAPSPPPALPAPPAPPPAH